MLICYFTSLAKNHTVTQSSFAAPCTNITGGGIDSGFQFIAPNATTISQYSFTLNNVTGPLWFYCRQANHCQQGMVFAVNPTAEKSFDTFQRTAMALGSVNPGNATTSGSVPSGAPITAGSPSGATGLPSGSAAAATQGDSTPSETPLPNSAFRMSARSAVLFSGVGLVASLVL